MNKPSWKTYLLWILGVEAVGALSGFLTRDGVKIYSDVICQPPLSPPSIVFPIVWTILFLLMGVSAARIYALPASPQRAKALLIFATQLGFNFFWSIIFFNLQSFGFAFLWLLVLWGLILWMIPCFPQAGPRCRVAAAALSLVSSLCGLPQFRGVAAQPVMEEEKVKINKTGRGPFQYGWLPACFFCS